jgi:hypothetical protein
MSKGMKQEDIDKLFSGELSERDIDRMYGIKRKPLLGCLIVVVGTIIVWSFLGFFFMKYVFN